MSIKVYTDGACRGNPGPGGWGVFIIYNDSTKELFNGQKETTNNQMEILAAIEALKYLKDEEQEITLYTDSNYVRKGITEWINNWKINNWRTASKKPVANKELWIELDELTLNKKITWNWVKGHSGDPGNERADQLANFGADNVS
ncbi:MAG: ribonuclease HI [Gammaproteobacteria bacterium]|uniref:Ribonuclease H n=1 Tax=SAR86 cluster bacterium TaxID=2030880 RepID=A0A520N018_9GAMM|nr:ribonuclease HI [Gammaproteobacteria bacterium]MBA4729780.1 ribonuclease HI [SAR86 cluster bacterium]RZO26830.1 MAG: ribonuclease HI [SAR86 cluster bacterium]|tara:strand:+ start:664 stop:1098 length:435 start_codon:yes stop_codon:yes gene_type:complete